MATYHECFNCKATVEAHHRHCWHCGSNLYSKTERSSSPELAGVRWVDAGDGLASAIDGLVEQIGCRCKGVETGVCAACHFALDEAETAAGTWIALKEASTADLRRSAGSAASQPKETTDEK